MSAPGLHTEARKALPDKALSMPRILLRTPEDPEEPPSTWAAPQSPRSSSHLLCDSSSCFRLGTG